MQEIPNPQSPKYILTDIEGTTTDIAFVHKVLFPYSRERMESYCYDNSEDAAVKACLEEVRAMLAEMTGTHLKRQNPIEYLLHCIDVDIKEPALKTLQGMIWRTGYENGALKGHIYDDVVPALERWKNQNIGLGVYSSGSVAAQKLLFGYSVFGDITPYFSDYFDTKVGHKREQQSYENITQSLGLSPNEILFLSDIEAELDAAAAAGLQTIQLVREGTVASNRHKIVNDFSKINLL
jgi:enolase-phosphatase E1